MKIYSNDIRDFNELIDAIGQFFQIRDDLANLCSKEYADSKSYCEDLTEGKFSYPVIHAIKYSGNAEASKRLLGI
jgi:geranylgeranyl diphosphate synthase type 3